MEVHKINGLWCLSENGNFLCSLIGEKTQPATREEAERMLLGKYRAQASTEPTPEAYHVPGFGMPSYDHPRAVEHREIKMYGVPENQILSHCVNPNDMVFVNMFAMGILSDVQEMLARNPSDVERVRQALNQAKYCMSLVQAEMRRLEREEK